MACVRYADMLGIQFILIAGVFVAASNLCMRRSIDAGGSSKGFLMVQLFWVFLIAILLNPVRSGELLSLERLHGSLWLRRGTDPRAHDGLPRSIIRARPPRIYDCRPQCFDGDALYIDVLDLRGRARMPLYSLECCRIYPRASAFFGQDGRQRAASKNLVGSLLSRRRFSCIRSF